MLVFVEVLDCKRGDDPRVGRHMEIYAKSTLTRGSYEMTSEQFLSDTFCLADSRVKTEDCTP